MEKVAEVEKEADEVDETTSDTTTYQVIISSGINVRDTPSSAGKAVRVLVFNATVEVLQVKTLKVATGNQDWLQINNKEGQDEWVLARTDHSVYLMKADDTIYTVTAPRNVRDKSDSSGHVLRVLNVGDTFSCNAEVNKQGENYYQINNKDEWVMIAISWDIRSSGFIIQGVAAQKNSMIKNNA